MKTLTKFSLAILIAGIISGCATKDNEYYNLPPQRWYEIVLYDIQNKDLDSAQTHFVAFASEHISSLLLERTLLLLATAHIYEGEYIKASGYFDEYIKRFGTQKNIEYAEFLRLKAYFEVFDKPNRNQQLLAQCQTRAKQFLAQFPNSQYTPLVESMLTKFALGEFYLNNHIQELYKRLGKKDAAAVYQAKINASGFLKQNITPPKTAWYARPFE